MEILLLTVFLSLLLALLFLLLFLRSQRDPNRKGPEQESLLPFQDEKPVRDDRRRRPPPAP